MLGLIVAHGIIAALGTDLPYVFRTNFHCYPIQNGANEYVVSWRGSRYSLPWHFSSIPSEAEETCVSEFCAQRLWCADSGVMGRYVKGTGSDPAADLTLSFVWILSPDTRSQTKLAVRESGSDTSISTSSKYGPATVLVLGDTVYFYTYVGGAANTYGLPRLSAIQFDEYRHGVPTGDLWRYTLTAFNVLGYQGDYSWDASWSPLYPVGLRAVTVSVEDSAGHAWAIDSVMRHRAPVADRVLLVLSLAADTPSIHSVSREVLSAPGFACRAFANGSVPLCYRTGAARQLTWAAERQVRFGMTFAPLASSGLSSFELPTDLWLGTMTSVDGRLFAVLVNDALGTLVAFNGTDFYGVEAHPTDACPRDLSAPSGGMAHLCTYDTVDGFRLRQCAATGECIAEPGARVAFARENQQNMTLVKWMGPFTGEFVLFTVIWFDMGRYSIPFFACRPSQYKPEGDMITCLACPAGSRCDGEHMTKCPAGTYAPAGSVECTPCPTATHSGEGAGECEACLAGTYQDRTGQAACVPCAVGSFSDVGRARCTECSAGSYAAEAGSSSCRKCNPGAYQDRTGQSSCLACAAGFSSVSGAAHCSPCSDGFWCPGGTAEQRCLNHFGAWAARCEPCDDREHAWFEGRCTLCSELPSEYVCQLRTEGEFVFSVAIHENGEQARALAIGLGVGVPLVVIIIVIAGVAVYFHCFRSYGLKPAGELL